MIQARIAQLVAYGTSEVPGLDLAIPIVGKGCERDYTQFALKMAA